MSAITSTRTICSLFAAGPLLALAFVARPASVPAGDEGFEFDESRVYFEYNASAEDLGVHVFLDGEDWAELSIHNPAERKLFQVKGAGPYGALGLTELFFEGAEPLLADVPLDELLAMFPEGEYDFEGLTIDGDPIEGEGQLSHAIPDGPQVSTEVGPGSLLRIHWSEVSAPPPGFPNLPITIAGYQVIVEPSFQVTLPAEARRLTVSPEFVRALGPGEHKFEVLAIEENGNQTLREGSFRL